MASDAATARAVYVDPAELRAFVAGVLVELGFSADDARLGAEVMVRADLRGTHSHGVRYLGTYVPLIRGGAINAKAELSIVENHPGATVVDGDAGLGHVVAYKATELAIRNVKDGPSRVATVLVRNSNHFGAAFYFSMMLAQAGLIGIVFTNSVPVMAAPGSRSSILTNAPFSYGIPGPEGHHVVFDVALSHVAGSRVVMAHERGDSIPLGWLRDLEGRPTTDPGQYAVGGPLEPIGAHKGYGIALLVEILAGVLSGAGITHEVLRYRVFPEDPSRTGHSIIALDVEAFMPREQFISRMAYLRDEIHNAPLAEGATRIMLPGELEEEHEAESHAKGLELDAVIWTGLQEVAREFGCEAALEGAVVRG